MTMHSNIQSTEYKPCNYAREDMVKNLIHCSAQYRPSNPTSVTKTNPTVSFHRTACTLLPGRRHLDPLPKDQCPYDQDRHCVEQPKGIDEGARKMNSGSQVTARGWWWWLEREELLQNSLVVLAARPAIIDFFFFAVGNIARFLLSRHNYTMQLRDNSHSTDYK